MREETGTATLTNEAYYDRSRAYPAEYWLIELLPSHLKRQAQRRNEVLTAHSKEGIERLFFELASESRLGILRELQTKNLKMQEIARRLDLTATEAVRQLKRLTEALLIQRQPEGSYTITQYGELTHSE